METPKVENILPKMDYRTTNPNMQVYSEELAKALEEKQLRAYKRLGVHQQDDD
jgi:hypothetical protein